MQTNSGKLLNFRPIILICANLILGILCTVTLCYTANLYIFLGCAFLILNLVLFAVFLIKKNKRLYITILISLIAMLVVCVPFSIKIFNNLNAKSVGEILFNCEVVAVNSISKNDYNYTISAYLKVLDGTLTGETIKVYLNTDALLFEGYTLTLSGNLNSYKFYSNSYLDASALRAGVNYFLSNAKIIEQNTQILNPFYYIKHLLYDRLSTSNAPNYEFMFALLTGDTNFISDAVLSRFRDTGVAHIFAVSGLHIGFLYAFISLIFKPIKIKGGIKYFLTLILLFLYVVFCGQAASCLRAFVLIMVTSFAKTFGFKNDRLSAVFFSMILVLMLNCEDLFGVGFYLSFTACLSLIFITPKIEKLLTKILPIKVVKFIAPFISAYLGTLPIVNDCFMHSSMLSMLFNLFIVPFMSFIFILCFISGVIVLIVSKLYFILQVASFFVGGIIWFVNTFSFIIISANIVFGISAVFYYFGLALFSGVINVKVKTAKVIQISNIFAFLLVFLLINI